MVLRSGRAAGPGPERRDGHLHGGAAAHTPRLVARRASSMAGSGDLRGPRRPSVRLSTARLRNVQAHAGHSRQLDEGQQLFSKCKAISMKYQ